MIKALPDQRSRAKALCASVPEAHRLPLTVAAVPSFARFAGEPEKAFRDEYLAVSPTG
ncbi:hypothetical protein ACCAA_80009 [Candidatus Accumulibacter aalborgensis]|uniref:Uncharacterized protein n=1 Tax=Candidatus Accumulibacter aalborgensis TaxID=1860102 RepID=A0A1A8XY60_9PROT|nr:hypothetical protein [Candidatus Accumulibacter aalborgensis]SBT09905.1 hypothetical protein ACCAA_80009 [Candidatus Accumulibacter aalborgensis]